MDPKWPSTSPADYNLVKVPHLAGNDFQLVYRSPSRLLINPKDKLQKCVISH